MDEIKKSNIDEKKSLFGKIKSKYVQKWIFNFISKYKYPEFANKFLKYNNGLSHLQLEITNDNRINRLSDFRNWYHDLKDIYSTSLIDKDFKCIGLKTYYVTNIEYPLILFANT